MSTLTQFFGGGGVPIGSLVDVPDYAPNVYEVVGQTYLRSGVTALGATYPQVPSSLLGDVYENEQFGNTGIADHAVQEFIGVPSDSSASLGMEIAQNGTSTMLNVFTQKTSAEQSQYKVTYYLLSTDSGVTWKRYLLPHIQDSYAAYSMTYVTTVAFFNGKFYLFYNNTTLRTSTDGISWTLVTNSGLDFAAMKTKVVNNRLFIFAYRWTTAGANSNTTASGYGAGSTSTSYFFYTSDGNTWTKNTGISSTPHDVTFDGTNYYFINTGVRGVYKGAAVQGNPPASGYTALGTGPMQTIVNGWTPHGGHWPTQIEWDATNSKIWCLFSQYYYSSYYAYSGITMYTSTDGGTNWQRIDIGPYTSGYPSGSRTSYQLTLIGADLYIPWGNTYLMKIVRSTNAFQFHSIATTWFEGTTGAGTLGNSAAAYHVKHGTNYIVTSFTPNISGPIYRIWKFSEQTPYSMTAQDELYYRGYASGYTRLVRKSQTEFVITTEPVNSVANSTIQPYAYQHSNGYLTQNLGFSFVSAWGVDSRAYLWDHYLHSTDNGQTFTERKMPYKAKWHIGKGQGGVFYAFARHSISQQTTFWQTNPSGSTTADNRVYTSTDLINWTRVGDFATSTYVVYETVGTPDATIVYSYYPVGGIYISVSTDNGTTWPAPVQAISSGFTGVQSGLIYLPRPVYDATNNTHHLYSISFTGSGGTVNFMTSQNNWTSFTSNVIASQSVTDAIKIGPRQIVVRDGSVAISDDNWISSTNTLTPTLTEFENTFLLSGVLHYNSTTDTLYVRIGNRLYISKDKGQSFFRNDTQQVRYSIASGNIYLLSMNRLQVENHVNDIEQIAGNKIIYLTFSGLRSPLTGNYIQNQKFVSGATNTAKYMRVA